MWLDLFLFPYLKLSYCFALFQIFILFLLHYFLELHSASSAYLSNPSRQFKIHIFTYIILYCFFNFLPLNDIFTLYNYCVFLRSSTLVILKLIISTFLFNSALVLSILCFSIGLIISGTFRHI